jgi:integrase
MKGENIMAKTRKPNGMGNIYKRDNGRYEWTQTINGERRYLSSMDRSELEEQIRKIANLPIVKNKYKVEEWFEKWLENYILPLKKDATYNQYKTLWEKHIKPKIGHKLIKKISKIDIQEVITDMNKKKLSTWTMKHTRKVMHIAFSKALEERYIAENPVINIEIPNKQSKPRKTLTIQELQVLFEALKETRWYWCFRFLLVTGLRRGEILALRHSDIDYKNRRIIVDESNSITGIGDTKSSKIHYVPLSDEAIYFLSKQKEMLFERINPALFNTELKRLDLIFPSENGTLMRPDSLNSVLDRISVKTGIHATPHMFRHTFVYMSKGHMSLSELQEALGHDESTTTLDIYGTMLGDTKTAANKIDDVFKGLDEEMDKIKEKVIEKEKAKVIQLNKFRNAK